VAGFEKYSRISNEKHANEGKTLDANYNNRLTSQTIVFTNLI